MKRRLCALLSLLVLGHATLGLAAEQVKPETWPLRYTIFVETERWYKAGLENWRDNPKRKGWMEGFIPAFFVKAEGAKERLAAMHIDFDQKGTVLTQTLGSVPLVGAFDSKYLQLMTPRGYTPKWLIGTNIKLGAYPHDPLNGDAEWEEGRMTFCGHREMERLNAELINSVDGPTIEIKLKPEEGIFYCNDWSKQLANPDRPWIDVTSYEKRGPRVRELQGYGLFGLIKPVVGKHYKTWICFVDCPDGKPGPIANIKAWSKKYELPVEDRGYGL